MSYQELTQFNSPNYTPASQVPSVYGMSRSIEGVTYHWWGDPAQNPQFLNIISWLCRANGDSSANVVGEGGRVAWLIDAINAAWHAGNARGNATTVGYECNPRLSDADYETMGEFHYSMEKAYGRRLSIYVHFQWRQTACSPINKDRIRQIADRFHNQGSTPAPAPVKETGRENYSPARRFKITQDCILENIPNGGNAGTRTYPAGEQLDIAQKLVMSDGSVWFRTPYSASKELATGFRAGNVAEVVVEPPQPEWIRNLKDIDDLKLSVLPAAGSRVVDLNTLSPVNETIIPRGTQVDIAKETTIAGNKYLLSSYAVNGGKPWGILASELGVPVVEPPAEKPEWLRNLKDIADVDMWLRSEAPVLRLSDGVTTRKVQLNDKVRITHSTFIVGNELLVLDGGTEAIQTIYLSNTPIKNPNDDIEQRLSVLEAIVKTITDFLSGLFKGFNK